MDSDDDTVKPTTIPLVGRLASLHYTTTSYRLIQLCAGRHVYLEHTSKSNIFFHFKIKQTSTTTVTIYGHDNNVVSLNLAV